jgi:hypothetical protein
MQLTAIDDADVPLLQKVFRAVNGAIHLMINNPNHLDLVMPMCQIVLIIFPVKCFC